VLHPQLCGAGQCLPHYAAQTVELK